MKLKDISILFLLCTVLINCRDDDDRIMRDTVEATVSAIEFTPAGGKQSFSLRKNGTSLINTGSIIINIPEEWCTVSTTVLNINVIAEENMENKERCQELEIKYLDKTIYIPVKQEAGAIAAELEISKDTLTIYTNSTRDYVQIKADGIWKFINIPEWCRITPSEGFGDKSVTFTAYTNTQTQAMDIGIRYQDTKSLYIKRWGNKDAYISNTADNFSNILTTYGLFGTIEKLKIKGIISTTDLRALQKITKLEEVDLSETSLSDSSVTLPAFAMAWCYKLKSVILPSGLLAIGSDAFNSCISLEEFVVPVGIITIEAMAFNKCENLSSVSFPETLEVIGELAFQNSQLKRIEMHAKNPPAIKQNSFSRQTYENAVLYVPTGTKSVYLQKEHWSLFKSIIEF